jgi:Uma2 family endonuclease
LFIAKENYHIITEKNISGAPDLVIEILSEGTAYRDLIDKKELYAQFGVKEYWLVDPKKQRVEVFENKNGNFVLTQQLTEAGKVKSKILNGFEVNLTEIFNQD